MALTITDRGGNAENVSDTSFGVSPSANLGTGPRSFCFVVAEWDNSATLGADPFTSVTDTKGNTYTQVWRTLNDPGAANAGCVVGVFYTDQAAGALTTSDTVTLTLSVATPIKCIRLIEVQAGVGMKPNVAGSNSATYSTASPTITTTDTFLVGELCIGVDGFQHAAAVTTPDADTTNGTWTTQVTSTAGASTSGGRITWQSKIQTTTFSTQTFNNAIGGTSHVGVIGWVRVNEVSTGGAVALDAKAASSSSAKSVLARTRPMGGKLGTSSGAKAPLARSRPAAAKVSTVSTAKATKLTTSARLAGKTGTASSAKANLSAAGSGPTLVDGFQVLRALKPKSATSSGAKASAGRAVRVAAKAAIASSIQASRLSRLKPVAAKAATSTSARATGVRKTLAIKARSATSSSARALVRRNRGFAARSSVVTSTKGSLVTLRAALVAHVSISSSAKATFRRTTRLLAKSGIATSAKATLTTGAGKSYAAKSASASRAKASLGVERTVSGRSRAVHSAKGTTIGRVRPLETHLPVVSGLVGVALRGRALVVKLATALGMRGTHQTTSTLSGKVAAATSATAEMSVKLSVEHDVYFVISAPQTKWLIGPPKDKYRMFNGRGHWLVGAPSVKPHDDQPEKRLVTANPRM
jgi:hypothetical protein